MKNIGGGPDFSATYLAALHQIAYCADALLEFDRESTGYAKWRGALDLALKGFNREVSEMMAGMPDETKH